MPLNDCPIAYVGMLPALPMLEPGCCNTLNQRAGEQCVLRHILILCHLPAETAAKVNVA